MEKEVNKLGELGDFTPENSSDITFDMYKNFADSEESLRRYGDAFSDFYYISCLVLPDESDSLEDEEELGEDIENQADDGGLSADKSDSKYDEKRLAELKKLFPDKSLEEIKDWIEDDGIDWKKVREEQKMQWENAISKFKKYPGLYNILQRCSFHMQNWYPLEILIGKYSEESMAKARKFTEERRKEFEGMGFTVGDPREYVYILGYFGGSTGRANQEIIKDIRDMFPDKVKEIKIGV